jgi:hypothetical protein
MDDLNLSVYRHDTSTVLRFTRLVWRGPHEHECRYFLGALSDTGHGKFQVGSRRDSSARTVTAHRFAYVLAGGTLDADTVVRHACDEPSCQHPEHLIGGTAGDNLADWFTRRRRVRGPLADVRGAAGRALAVRAALLAAIVRHPHSLVAQHAAVLAAQDAGEPHRAQLELPIGVSRSVEAVDHPVIGNPARQVTASGR